MPSANHEIRYSDPFKVVVSIAVSGTGGVQELLLYKRSVIYREERAWLRQYTRAAPSYALCTFASSISQLPSIRRQNAAVL